MATFKHISSKNADYGAAEQYLTFEHDEFTMKPTLDGNGRLVLCDDYRISSLNCGGEDFAIACMRSNLKYGKNQKREDVKSHHYIISFDPRDAPDNGLTVDRAQQLGEQFCREHFPGHQALVCTHPDGHNHSGNIHVHIVINSLRIEEVPLLGGCFAINNIRIMDSQKGMFLAMPDRQDAKGEYRDVCFPTTAEMRQALTGAVMGEYQRVMELMAERGIKARNSMRDALQPAPKEAPQRAGKAAKQKKSSREDR